MPESQIKVERWKQYLEQANTDEKWKLKNATVNEKRRQIRTELLDLLNRFMTGAISVELFRAEFDSKTRTVWTVFGLKGLSGAMFLNKLVKFIRDAELLTAELKAVLSPPSNPIAASAQLASFMDFLQTQIDSEKTTKGQLQPARASFFVSAWWHMHDSEAWPIYYQSGRKALELEEGFSPKGNTVEDYFSFRELFNSLKTSLAVDAWQCEHLLDWYDQGSDPDGGGDGAGGGSGGTEGGTENDKTEESEDVEDDDEDATITHTQIQWLLAKLGHKFGCQVWIASNDQSKVWNGQVLGDLSIKSLPTLGLDSSSQKIISLIDVVWLKGSKQIAAAFEIEHTTSIYSGILRMSDLVSLSPNLNFPLYLVAPSKRMDKVRRSYPVQHFRPSNSTNAAATSLTRRWWQRPT